MDEARAQEKPAAGRKNPGGGGGGGCCCEEREEEEEKEEEGGGGWCRGAWSCPPPPFPPPPVRGPRTRTKHFVGALAAGPSGRPACSSCIVTRRSRAGGGGERVDSLSPSPSQLLAAAFEQGTTTSNASIGLRREAPKRMSTVALAGGLAEADEEDGEEEKKKEEQAASEAATVP